MSPKYNIWMPLYVGDYMADTIGLSHAQHGAYLLAMMKYWRKGESLTEPEFEEVCGKDLERVSKFFVLCDNRWHHKRIDEELKKVRDMAQKNHDKAMAMVAARKKHQSQ